MKDLRFTLTHEWLQQQDDEVLVGITDHAQQLLGDLVYVELPEIGAEVSAGDELGVVESVKAASDFYAPVSGIVTAVNPKLSNNPELVNSNPFDDGWLVKIKPTNPKDFDTLLTSEQYQNEIAEDN